MPKAPSSLTLALQEGGDPAGRPSTANTPNTNAARELPPPDSPPSPRTALPSSSNGRPQPARPIIPSTSSNTLIAQSLPNNPYRNGPPSSYASKSYGNLFEASSVTSGSTHEHEASSDAGSETSWRPPGQALGPERERRPSRHAIIQNMLSRSRSNRRNQDGARGGPPRLATTRLNFLDSRSREREPRQHDQQQQQQQQQQKQRQASLSPRTAPLEPERGFRDAMNSSAALSRNRSADRGREGPTTDAAPAANHPGRMAQIKQKASDVAGRAGKGLMDKFKSGSSSGGGPGDAWTPDGDHRFKILHLPLIEQTRRTRLRRRMSDAKDKTEFWMPALPYRAIDYLNSKGIEAEGLYRIPGSVKDVRYWQARFDKEGDVNLLDVTELEDVHTVGSMLKAWLREMPDQLIPKEVQSSIAAECVAARESGETPQALRDMLSKLPPFHYYLLFAITAHVALLYKFRDHNKMTYHNLCVCFQPCLAIDAPIFQFLVEDWKHCWQGCWTEKTYLEEEYRLMQGRPPLHSTTSSTSFTLAPSPFPDRAGSSTTPNLFRPSTAVSSQPDAPDHSPRSPRPLPNSSAGSFQSVQRPVRSETPPELAPVEPVSPMRM